MLFSSVADCDKRLPVQNKQKKQVLEICCLILLYRTITEQWPQNQSNAPNHDSSVPLHSTGYQDLYGKISCNWYLFVRYVKGKTWHLQKKSTFILDHGHHHYFLNTKLDCSFLVLCFYCKHSPQGDTR